MNKKSPKKRLDILLLERNLAENINEARALIMSGSVFCNTRSLTKIGELVSTDEEVHVKHRKEHIWVSRGGTKLEHAIKHFSIEITGSIAIDVGASTGGFTDVLLHYGAKKIYAVDVGYGELAWKLRNDPRVMVFERKNARHLTENDISEKLDIIVCDTSFVSLKSILPPVFKFAKKGTQLVALIKPQFEAEKFEVGEGGIIKDVDIHKRICDDIISWLSAINEWQVIGITESPIKGMNGNTEFLLYAVNV